MAYYKVHIELWCNWDAASSSLDEIDDQAAMSFFGGDMGDAEQSQG
jgi:hypothetical protein